MKTQQRKAYEKLRAIRWAMWEVTIHNEIPAKHKDEFVKIRKSLSRITSNTYKMWLDKEVSE